MKNAFKITAFDGRARCGELKTPHGIIETPVFMPVGTQGTIKGVPHEMLSSCSIILSNAYYLYLKPGVEILIEHGGLHKFMNWEKAILTDSGGFQIFSLPDLFKISGDVVEFRSKFDGGKHFWTSEDVVDFQYKIGSDIIMVLDRCLEFPQHLTCLEKAVNQTIRWAQKSIKHFRLKYETKQKIFAITQGGVHKKLREKCAGELSALPFDGYAVGGLGVGEPAILRKEILAEALPALPEEKPRYVMGMGPADEIWESVENGADMFDCVLPTRNGRNAQAFTFKGKLNLRNAQFKKDKRPIDEKCLCPACKRYTRSYIHHLFDVHEMLAQTLTSLHNINFMINLMSLIKTSIRERRFMEEKNKFISAYNGG